MQLQNTPIPQQAISVARSSLPQSDAMLGLQAMTPPNAGMFNSDDGGAMSKPYINAQPSENQALGMQSVNQNAMTQAPQLIAGATDNIRRQATEKEQQRYRDQKFMTDYADRIIEEKGMSTAGLMKVNSMIQSPEREAFINNIATGRAMYAQVAPELGAYAAQTQQYRPM